MKAPKKIKSLKDLTPDDRNANRGSERGKGMIQTSLRAFGAGRSVLCDRNGNLIAGNKTVENAAEVGLKKLIVVPTDGTQLVVVQRVDLDIADPKARELAVADNRTGEVNLVWDAAELQRLQEDGCGLEEFFSDAEMEQILSALTTEEEPDATASAEPESDDLLDRAAECQKRWKVKAGDLFAIGEHRVLCGDTTNPEAVARLMGGRKAQGVFTSPPYADQRKGQYGGTPVDLYVDWWEGVQKNVRDVLAPDGSFFVNIKPHCKDGERALYVMDLVLAMRRRWGWGFVYELCWVRRSYPGSAPNRFKNAWEPVYHFAQNPTGLKFRPRNVLQPFKTDIDQLKVHSENPCKKTSNGSPFEVGGKRSYDGAGAWPDNVIEAFGSQGKEGHPAAFPVDLVDFFLQGFSDEGDVWFEPFGGGGTVMVAAEKSNRVCYAVEKMGKYVAVNLEMMSRLGLEPVKL